MRNVNNSKMSANRMDTQGSMSANTNYIRVEYQVNRVSSERDKIEEEFRGIISEGLANYNEDEQEDKSEYVGNNNLECNADRTNNPKECNKRQTSSLNKEKYAKNKKCNKDQDVVLPKIEQYQRPRKTKNKRMEQQQQTFTR